MADIVGGEKFDFCHHVKRIVEQFCGDGAKDRWNDPVFLGKFASAFVSVLPYELSCDDSKGECRTMGVVSRCCKVGVPQVREGPAIVSHEVVNGCCGSSGGIVDSVGDGDVDSIVRVAGVCTSAGGGSVSSDVDLKADLSSSPVLGCKTKRQFKRDKRRAFSAKFSKNWNEDKESRQVSAVSAASVDSGRPSGFWNSCSPDVRQKLIDSKAEMHVAENLRKAREAQSRADFLVSPQAAVEKAVKYAELAEKLALKSGESLIHGYAQAVSSGSASSLVKSLPDSVTSFEDYQQRKMDEVIKETVADYSERVEVGLKEQERLKNYNWELERKNHELNRRLEDLETNGVNQSGVDSMKSQIALLKKKNAGYEEAFRKQSASMHVSTRFLK